MNILTLKKLGSFLDQSLIGIIVIDKEFNVKVINNNYKTYYINQYSIVVNVNDNLQKHLSESCHETWSKILSGKNMYYGEFFYGPIPNAENDIVGAYSMYSRTQNSQPAMVSMTPENVVLAKANHELRTPLVSILGSAQLLELSIPKTQTYQKYRQHIQSILVSGEHLQHMIDDFLDFFKLQSNKMYVDTQSIINLNTVITKCVAMMKSHCDKYKVQITTSFDDKNYYVFGDQDRMVQILLNLLSNAIKYNIENGKVVIKLKKPNEEFVQIDIVDTGVGIAKEDLPLLYQEYSRFGPKVDKVKGTGLGLAITKKLVDCMHGKIYVKSKIGRGTRFTLIFHGADGQPQIEYQNDPEIIIYLDEPELHHAVFIRNAIGIKYQKKIKIMTLTRPELLNKLVKTYAPILIINGLDELPSSNTTPILNLDQNLLSEIDVFLEAVEKKITSLESHY